MESSLCPWWLEGIRGSASPSPFGTEALGELVLAIETFSGIDFYQTEWSCSHVHPTSGQYGGTRLSPLGSVEDYVKGTSWLQSYLEDQLRLVCQTTLAPLLPAWPLEQELRSSYSIPQWGRGWVCQVRMGAIWWWSCRAWTSCTIGARRLVSGLCPEGAGPKQAEQEVG